MTCRKCATGGLHEFIAEMNIHIPGLRDLNRPNILIFPAIFVCSHCGFAEFTVPEAELRFLLEGSIAVDGFDKTAARRIA